MLYQIDNVYLNTSGDIAAIYLEQTNPDSNRILAFFGDKTMFLLKDFGKERTEAEKEFERLRTYYEDNFIESVIFDNLIIPSYSMIYSFHSTYSPKYGYIIKANLGNGLVLPVINTFENEGMILNILGGLAQ